MIVFTDSEGRIKAVGSTADYSLIKTEITDEGNPFKGWSEAKICCYRVQVIDGQVVMMTPYLDSRLLDHIEQLGQQGDSNTSDISDNREGIMETFEATEANAGDVADLRAAVMEIYELLEGGE